MCRNSPLTGCPSISERHLLGQIAGGHCADDACNLGGGLHQVADQRVDRSDAGGPAAARFADRGPLVHAPFATHHPLDPHHLVGHRLVELDQPVEALADLLQQRIVVAQPQADREVPVRCGRERLVQRDQRLVAAAATRFARPAGALAVTVLSPRRRRVGRIDLHGVPLRVWSTVRQNAVRSKGFKKKGKCCCAATPLARG